MSTQFEQAQGIHEIEWLGREVWLVKEAWGELVIAKMGAQVLHFKPLGQQDVFWLNMSAGPLLTAAASVKKTGGNSEAVRGGAPLCWPWFGPHETDHSLPNHGFARVVQWQLDVCRLQSEGALTKLRFSPIAALSTDLSVSFDIEVSDNVLKMCLITRNVSDQIQPLTQAIHSYFLVGDSEKVQVNGLKGCEYIDKLAANNLAQQSVELTNIQAIDSIYKHAGEVVLRDEVLGRELIISKAGSGSTVVWNPGALAVQYDILAGQREFVCVEAANTAHENIMLIPHQSVRLEQSITVIPLVL